MSEAQSAAARSETITFTYDGDEYTVANGDDISIDLLEAIEARRTAGAIRAILGEAGWAKFRERHDKVSHLNEIADKWSEATGSGNPSSSPQS